MLLYAFASFALGLLLLLLGADWFLKGASAVALRFGISPFVVGLTLVGFGTSSPELAVNLSAVARGSYDLALGNVVGSNVANIGLILGCCAVVTPLALQMRLLKVETPLLIAISVVLWVLCLDGRLGRGDGLLLLGGFAWLMFYVYHTARDEPDSVQAELAEIVEGADGEEGAEAGTGGRRPTRYVLRLVVGLILLVYGANEMVGAAVTLARIWGISELVIGLTVVAIGTSLPELASSVLATLRGQTDVAIGNVIGSNLFNILLILGVTATVHPLPVTRSMLIIELPLMITLTAILYPMFLRDLKVDRKEGVILLLLFCGFMGWQVVTAMSGG